MVHKIFNDMIKKSSKMSKVEIWKQCAESWDGQKLLDKISLRQKLNCIKYKRLTDQKTNLEELTELRMNT